MKKPCLFSAEFLVFLDNNSAFLSSLCSSFFVTGHKSPVFYEISYLQQSFDGISNEGMKTLPKQPLSQPGKSFLMASSLMFAGNNFHLVHSQEGWAIFSPSASRDTGHSPSPPAKRSLIANPVPGGFPGISLSIHCGSMIYAKRSVGVTDMHTKSSLGKPIWG